MMGQTMTSSGQINMLHIQDSLGYLAPYIFHDGSQLNNIALKNFF